MVPGVSRSVRLSQMNDLDKSASIHRSHARSFQLELGEARLNADGSGSQIFKGTVPINSDAGGKDARNTVCRGNRKRPVARDDFDTRLRIHGIDISAICAEPNKNPLGSLEARDGLLRINKRFMAHFQRRSARQADHERILRCQLGRTTTSALNFRVFIPPRTWGCELEFQEAIHHCFVKH